MNAYSYRLIRHLLLGRVMTASDTVRALSVPIGPLAAGLLLTHVSPRIAIAVLVAPVVIAAALGTASSSLRNLPSLSTAPTTVS